jgi:hypothetical protein
MRVPNRMLYRAELVAAAASACLLLLSLIEPQWIEILFDEAPDGGDGSLERWVAIVCSGVALLVFSGLARREKRRLGIAH